MKNSKISSTEVNMETPTRLDYLGLTRTEIPLYAYGVLRIGNVYARRHTQYH